jgi:hypothetical protein
MQSALTFRPTMAYRDSSDEDDKPETDEEEGNDDKDDGEYDESESEGDEDDNALCSANLCLDSIRAMRAMPPDGTMPPHGTSIRAMPPDGTREAKPAHTPESRASSLSACRIAACAHQRSSAAAAAAEVGEEDGGGRKGGDEDLLAGADVLSEPRRSKWV